MVLQVFVQVDFGIVHVLAGVNGLAHSLEEDALEERSLEEDGVLEKFQVFVVHPDDFVHTFVHVKQFAFGIVE